MTQMTVIVEGHKQTWKLWSRPMTFVIFRGAWLLMEDRLVTYGIMLASAKKARSGLFCT